MYSLAALLLRNFLPIFAGSISFFVILINLSDLFLNIVRYLEQEVTAAQLLLLQALFLPQCIVFALPIALLFSVSYSMGTLYANNELIAVFASGVNLKRFILPLIVLATIFSVALFFIQDRLAIPMLKEKQTLSMQLLRNQPVNLDQSNVTIQSLGGRVLYQAGYYNNEQERLSDVTVIMRNDDLLVDAHIYADWAEWNGSIWEFYDVTHIRKVSGATDDPAADAAASTDAVDVADVADTADEPSEFIIEKKAQHSQEDLNLPPNNFENQFGDIDEMSVAEAGNYISFLRDSGFPFKKQLTKYHERFSFALTPLIVTMLSAAIGGKYRKNILGLSLLVSLGISIIYYCLQLFTALLATIGVLDSVIGAWAGVLLSALLAGYLLNKAKT